MFSAATYKHGPVAAIPCQVVCGYDKRGTTRYRHHNLEDVQGVSHHLAVEDILHADRLPVKKRFGVGLRVAPLGHGNTRHGSGVIAVPVCVLLGDHGVAGILPDMTIGQIELCFRRTKAAAVRAELHGCRDGRRVCVRIWRGKAAG